MTRQPESDPPKRRLGSFKEGCALGPTPAAAKKSSKKAPSGQREMLMAIPGKGESKKAAAKDPKKSRPARARKAG
jgi:hypothetical protein